MSAPSALRAIEALMIDGLGVDLTISNVEGHDSFRLIIAPSPEGVWTAVYPEGRQVTLGDLATVGHVNGKIVIRIARGKRTIFGSVGFTERDVVSYGPAVDVAPANGPRAIVVPGQMESIMCAVDDLMTEVNAESEFYDPDTPELIWLDSIWEALHKATKAYGRGWQ